MKITLNVNNKIGQCRVRAYILSYLCEVLSFKFVLNICNYTSFIRSYSYIHRSMIIIVIIVITVLTFSVALVLRTVYLGSHSMKMYITFRHSHTHSLCWCASVCLCAFVRASQNISRHSLSHAINIFFEFLLARLEAKNGTRLPMVRVHVCVCLFWADFTLVLIH